MDAYYRETNANVHRGVYELAAEATARYEAGRDAVARLVGAPARHGGLHQERHRGDQPGRLGLGRAQPDGRRRDPRHRDGAPLATSSRGRSSPASPARRCGSRRSPPGASSTWTPSPRLLTERTRIVGVVHVSNVLGTINPVAEITRHGPRAGRPGAGGRLAERPPHAGRRPGDRLRLLRLHRPQDARPHGHRRAGRTPRAAGGDGALPRRRRDDLQRQHRRVHLGRPALEVRGRHARRSPRRSAWARPPTT